MKTLRETAIIIMNLNRLDYLQRCLESVERNTADVAYELVIVDAGSSDESRRWLLDNYASRATLLFEGRRYSYAQSNNRAMRLCREPYIALLNNDMLVEPGWLRIAIDTMRADESIGHLAHKLLWAGGTHIQTHGANISREGNSHSCWCRRERNDPEANRPANFAYAGLGLYRRDVLEQVGYLAEWPNQIYWPDTDHGMRVNALGLDVRYCPQSEVIHLLVEDENKHGWDDAAIGRHWFKKSWGEFLEVNDGFVPRLPKRPQDRPWRNGHPGEKYRGESYRPLGWAPIEIGIGNVLDG